MANIGRLMVEISANISKLDSELNKGQNKISAFAKAAGSSLLSIGKYVGAGIAAATAAIGYMILTTTTKIADLVDEAQQFGLPIQELQRFQYAAKLAGVSAEGFGTTLQFMLKNIEEAHLDEDMFSEGAIKQTGELANAFKTLGLNIHELDKLDTAKKFRAIGEAFNGISDSGQRVKLAMTIFGRSGVQVLNVFKDGLSATSAEFDKLGLGITDSQGKAVAAFDDARTRLGALWQGFKEQTTAAVAPAFEAITNYIIKAIQDFGGIRNAGLTAGQYILKGLLMVIRGVESFISAIAGGFNNLIITLETIALAILDVAKYFITDNALEDKIDKQMKFLNDDLAERSKPAGERAGKLFGESFAGGLKGMGDAVEKELDKLMGKPGSGGFGSITDAFGNTKTIGDQTSAQRAAALEADYQKTLAVIRKYDAISASNTGMAKAGPAFGSLLDLYRQPGTNSFGNVAADGTAFGRNFDRRPGTGWSGTGMNDFPDIEGPKVRIALDVNLTADKDGNLVAAVQKGALRQAVENVIVDLVVGTGKVFQSIKDSF